MNQVMAWFDAAKKIHIAVLLDTPSFILFQLNGSPRDLENDYVVRVLSRMLLSPLHYRLLQTLSHIHLIHSKFSLLILACVR